MGTCSVRTNRVSGDDSNHSKNIFFFRYTGALGLGENTIGNIYFLFFLSSHLFLRSSWTNDKKCERQCTSFGSVGRR